MRSESPAPPAEAAALRIAIVGAESTGKTALARTLSERIAASTGLATTWVPEVLRAWCDAAGRTPHQHEQAEIAQAQHQRIDEAARTHQVVVCDTTALMTAVYSEMVFGDRTLYGWAAARHAECQLTLLTALDLPWQADGLQRDGPHVRVPVDNLIRQALLAHGLPWALVAGQGPARVEAALDAVAPLLRSLPAPRGGLFTRLAERDAAAPAWQWACDECDQPQCEHAWLRQRQAGAA